jgi:hypothetical protein
MTPTDMLNSDRPRMYRSVGRISLTRPHCAPPYAELARPAASVIASRPQTGTPGMARPSAAAVNSSPRTVSVARGGIRSAMDSSVAAPMTWANEAPNMASADSSGDLVAA